MTLTFWRTQALLPLNFLIEHSWFCICQMFLSDYIEVTDSWPKRRCVVPLSWYYIWRYPLSHQSLIDEVDFDIWSRCPCFQGGPLYSLSSSLQLISSLRGNTFRSCKYPALHQNFFPRFSIPWWFLPESVFTSKVAKWWFFISNTPTFVNQPLAFYC